MGLLSWRYRGRPSTWTGFPQPHLKRKYFMSEEAFIYEAIRTPRGKNKNGALNEVKPVNLVTGLVDELRAPGEGRRGMVGRLLRQVRRPGQGPERPRHPRSRRAHAARHHDGGPGQAEDRVRRRRRDGRLRRCGAAEVPLGREDQPRPHRRQQLRHRRRRRAGARRQ